LDQYLSESAHGSANRPGTEELLREIAREMAASRRWNVRAVYLMYGLLAAVLVLRLEAVNTVLVASLAAVGLFTFWLAGSLRRRRQKERLLLEKLADLGGVGVAEPAPPSDPRLSKRELEVLSMIADGMTNKKIADVLGVSPHTVKNHAAHIFSKLNVEDRTSAVLLAASQGWIRPTPKVLPHYSLILATGSAFLSAALATSYCAGIALPMGWM
jgi:DNA-binding CsgD family transcriptional regulator